MRILQTTTLIICLALGSIHLQAQTFFSSDSTQIDVSSLSNSATYDRIRLTSIMDQIIFQPVGYNHYYFMTKPTENKAFGMYGPEEGWFTSWKTGSGDMIIHQGKLGIGTNDPRAKLQIMNQGQGSDGNTLILGSTNGSNLRLGYHTEYSWIQSHGSKPLRLNELGNNTILNLNSGNVGIGTSSPDERLSVKGNIHAEEVRVDLNVPGPDYVFEPDYPLAGLDELEAYIKVNKHLPEIPSAREMEENGIHIGEMNMLLLKKIEELTLYVLTHEKTLREEKRKHAAAIEELIQRIEQLERAKDH